MEVTQFRTCPLCEATCGLEITVRDGAVQRIRGDRDDVFSHGFICPKGSTLKQLHEDPDRLRTPLIRRGEGHVEATWDEAFAEIDRRLTAIIAEHGPNSVGVYLGNPNVHTLGSLFWMRPLLHALGSRNIFSASTVDQMPRHVSSGLMYGDPNAFVVPDLDRTDYLLMLGANPYESNGSLATAPDWPGRLEAIQSTRRPDRRRRPAAHTHGRGGRRAPLDPAGHRRPVPVCARQRHRRGGSGRHRRGDTASERSRRGTRARSPASRPRRSQERTGIAADDDPPHRPRARRRRARRGLRTHRRAHRAGRDGRVVGDRPAEHDHRQPRPAGRRDVGPRRPRPPTPAGRQRPRLRDRPVDAAASRVSPEVNGELPVAALAEEIETEGPGQIRAMITIAGNPVLTTPHSDAARRGASPRSSSWSASTSISTRRHATPT